MSEEHPSDAAPPEEGAVVQSVSPPNAEKPPEHRRRWAWVAPAWFFFGIIVGIAGFAAYTAFIVKPAAPAAQDESLDTNSAMRVAARQGMLEAIATLQAGGGQQQPAAQEPQGPQAVASNAFTVREANRQGSANAKVTIYEFSDFQ